MWVIRVILVVLTFSFSVTGYSLPWDQIGYWASLSKDFYNQSYRRFQIIIKHFSGSWDFNFLEMGKIFGIRKFFCLYFLYLVFLLPFLLTIPILGLD
jgi:quinol-cytochrome oxidoreductase complex cytochrome b subunit